MSALITILALVALVPGIAYAANGQAGSVNVRVIETSTPQWYGGLQFRVEADDAPGRHFLFWPQEGIAVEEFEFIERSQIHNLRTRTSGAISYEVRGLRTPDVSVAVDITPGSNVLDLQYGIRNGSDEIRFVSIAPCFQLPAEFFGRQHGWMRAKRVFVATAENGLRWISDTAQIRGIRSREGDPDPARSPWSQHFFATRNHDHEDFAHDSNSGLNLFGVADEHVSAGFICAFHPRSDTFIAAVTDSETGVTYSLLNCLHANIGRQLQPHETVRAQYRVFFHRGSLSDLTARILAEFPDVRLPDPDLGFVSPASTERILESFESETLEWTVARGDLVIVRADDPYFSSTDGDSRLEARIEPGSFLSSGALTVPAVGSQGAQVSLDIGAPGTAEQMERVTIEVVVIEDAREVSQVTARLARGKFRRVIIPLPGPRAASVLRLEIRPLNIRRSIRLALDAVAIHQPPES